jgi:hypothetical protein
VVQNHSPLIRELYHAADFSQMWPKICPSLEDCITQQQTLAKCGQKYAPHRRTLSCSGLQPNVAPNMPHVGGPYHAVDFDQIWPKNVPLIGGLYHAVDFSQMWPKIMPLVGGLYHAADFGQMWPKNVPLIGGLCHIANFDQMWPKNMSLIRGFHLAVHFDQMWPKKCAPCCKTVSHNADSNHKRPQAPLHSFNMMLRPKMSVSTFRVHYNSHVHNNEPQQQMTHLVGILQQMTRIA